jgi:hypothetical protein
MYFERLLSADGPKLSSFVQARSRFRRPGAAIKRQKIGRVVSLKEQAPGRKRNRAA